METAVPQTPPPGGDGPNEPAETETEARLRRQRDAWQARYEGALEAVSVVAAAMEAAIAAAGPAPTLTQPDPADWIAARA